MPSPLMISSASCGSSVKRTVPNSGVSTTDCPVVSPRDSERRTVFGSKPALESCSTWGRLGLKGTTRGVKPKKAPSTVTLAPFGWLDKVSVASAGVRVMAPKSSSTPATILKAMFSGKNPGALSVSVCSPDKTSTPLAVMAAGSLSTAADAAVGIVVNRTCAQSGASATSSVWLWLRPVTVTSCCHD